MKISKKTLLDLFLLLVFKAMLEVSYKLIINPIYGYSGFILDLNFLKLFESYIFLIPIFLFLPRGQEKISTIGLKLLFLLIIVPTLSIYALTNAPRLYLYFLLVSFCITIFTVKIFPMIKIKKTRNTNIILVYIIGVITFIVYTVLIEINGIPTLKALVFANVYEIRSEVSWGLPIMGYLVPWQANIVNCFLIGFIWYKRRYFALILVAGLQILLFLIAGHKSFLFSPLLVIFVIYAVQKKKLMSLSLVGLISIILFSLALHQLQITNMPASLFIRRALFMPAKISFNYHDFFSQNEKMYLSQSKVGLGLAENPYEDYGMSTANMMGMIYLDELGCHMNTGYMGDSYMNFGFAGMVIFSLILGLIFVAADSFSKNQSIFVAIAVFAKPISGLTNGALFTVMLTGGLVLSFLFIYLLREGERIWCFRRGSIKIAIKD